LEFCFRINNYLLPSFIASLLVLFYYLGTFLYIATTDIIAEEFSIGKKKWQKLLFFLIGYSIMAILKVYEN
jgi:hypothetical protein